MRPASRTLAAVLALTALLTLSACGSTRKTQEAMRRATPAPTQPTDSAKAPKVATPNLPGRADDLKAALAEPSPIRYKVAVIDETPTPDVSTFFDSWLERGNGPAGDTLLLAVFAQSKHDLRFALGADLTARKLAVDDLLALVRSEYLPAAKDGDPAGGLARLIRAVNQKLGH